MSAKVDLYNNAYGNYATEVYREIRVETYGHDLGQTSWVTTQESAEIIRLLELAGTSYVLEIGCGSGRYAIHLAEKTGCRVLGIDINAPGIHNANQLAAAQNLSERVRFEICDASKQLPFADSTFDSVFSNDVLCHIPGRQALLHELFRVLKPNARILFSDALIIGGIVSHQEIAARSAIGNYLFSPPGENERLLDRAGFRLLNVTDTTANAHRIAGHWREARSKRADTLIAIEGQANFDGLQRFLATVETLNKERRLLRSVYLAQKPGANRRRSAAD
jgi:ubiquinone/menaquinone biosynthesis C-methylase UbiE